MRLVKSIWNRAWATQEQEARHRWQVLLFVQAVGTGYALSCMGTAVTAVDDGGFHRVVHAER